MVLSSVQKMKLAKLLGPLNIIEEASPDQCSQLIADLIFSLTQSLKKGKFLKNGTLDRGNSHDMKLTDKIVRK